jgi:hypothetical protein
LELCYNTSLKIIKNPQVYLVGKQSTDEEEIQRFLTDHDVVKWSTDTEVSGEKLSEMAGRLCYMSFSKPRPGGNHSYLNHILEKVENEYEERIKLNENKKIEAKPIGNPDLISANPGAVRYEDLKAYISKKNSERYKTNN